jgi:hypothetical protein
MEENELKEMFGESPNEEGGEMEKQDLKVVIEELRAEIETLKTEIKSIVEAKNKTKNDTENKTNSSETKIPDQDKEDGELARSYKESVEKETKTFEALISLCRSNKDLLEKIENRSLKSEITRSLEEQKSSETANSKPAESQFSDEGEVFEPKVEDYQRDIKSQKYQFTKN